LGSLPQEEIAVNEAVRQIVVEHPRILEEPEYFIRMTLNERLQHGALILSFFLLVLTGLPLIAYDYWPVKLLFFLNFSFELRGILHRVGAVVLILLCVWHLVYAVFTARGRETIRALMFRRKDLSDALQSLMHNLGLCSWLYRRGYFTGFFARHPYWLFREAPVYGRYNFIEKFEYFAVTWGTIVMILTGFFMWQVELAMRIFPKSMFDVFVTIHGYEAILAFLAIIIWHMYTVHLSPESFPMNKVWLTGKISRGQIEKEHPLEYREIQNRKGGA
jgi:cytochrome b subunit of formate dehydrogenase